MNCPKCNVAVADNAVVCHACGERIGPAEATTPATEQLLTGHLENGAENENWVEGPWHYSAKAMRGTFLAVGLMTIAFLALGVFLEVMGWVPSSRSWHVIVWALLLIIPGLAWLYEAGVCLYRTKTICYTLTPYRLLHEEGVLIRRKHVIEVVDIDDIDHTQTLSERFLCGDVGTITIRSSDPSSPVLEIRGMANHEEVFQKIDDARRKQRQKRGLKAI